MILMCDVAMWDNMINQFIIICFLRKDLQHNVIIILVYEIVLQRLNTSLYSSACCKNFFYFSIYEYYNKPYFINLYIYTRRRCTHVVAFGYNILFFPYSMHRLFNITKMYRCSCCLLQFYTPP